MSTPDWRAVALNRGVLREPTPDGSRLVLWVPAVYDGWSDFERYVRFLYSTGSIDEHTQLWWSVRPHLAFPTVEVRICDAQPDLRDAQSLAALIFSLGARFARAFDEREPLPSLPGRLIEENFWRAIRTGLSGGMIDFASDDVVPARKRIEQLIEWVEPVARELGTVKFLQVPHANAAERQYARLGEVGSPREVFAELVRRPRERVV